MTEVTVSVPPFLAAFIETSKSRRSALSVIRRMTTIQGKDTIVFLDAYCERWGVPWERAEGERSPYWDAH
jgi:hypothetical protein